MNRDRFQLGSWLLSLFLCLLALLIAWGAVAHAQDVQLSLGATVPHFGLQEITFQLAGKAANPYDPANIAVTAEFRAPSGKKLRLPAFFYEEFDPIRNTPGKEKTWKVRFAPAEVGEYIVRVLVSRRGAKAEEVAHGVFTSVRSRRKGFVKTRGRHFVLTTGERFFPLGANRCWGDIRQSEAYLEDMEALARSGASVIRVWLAPWWLPVEKRRGIYDQAACARLDAILAEADRLGLKIILCIEQHGNFEPPGNEIGRWPEHPYNAANGGPCRTVRHFFSGAEARRLFRNRLRYLVARCSYSTAIMAWELFNEVEWVPLEHGGFWNNRWVVEDWHFEMSAFFRKTDPFGHLVATSADVDLQLRLISRKAVDFVQVHVYDDTDPFERIIEVVADVRGKVTVPVVVGEFGRKKGKPGGNYVTRGIFAAFLAGGSGALPWLQDEKDVAAHYERIKTARSFFNGILWDSGNFEPMSAEDLIPARKGEGSSWEATHPGSLRFLALRGRDETLVLVRRGGASRVGEGPHVADPDGVFISGIRPGEYVVEYWNPPLGTMTHRASARVKSGRLLAKLAPFQGEVALKILWLRGVPK